MRRLLLYCMLSGMAYGMWAQERQNLVIYEDRVWEYTCGTDGTNRYKTIKARFEGSAVIEDKEYTRFCILSSVEYNRWNLEIVDCRDYSEESIEKRTLGYVREEEGKVYTFFDEEEYLIFDVTSPGIPVTCGIRWKIKDSSNTGTGLEPVEIELSESVSITNSGGIWQTYMVDRAYFEYVWNDTVEQYDLFDTSDYDPAPMFVVGVGPCGMSLGGGTVLGFEPAIYTPGGGIGYWLNCVYDLEGNVIFEGCNRKTPVVSVSSPIATSDTIKIVYDLTGREVSRGENATDGLTPGIYVVRKGNITTKTVIK
ncbi:MAG: T9SS type A sorting domain-containing protein [Muribaculaceae bacterium]|nr:T9SS type A sorting domain-containing protein [Muribaculaceae bacterium]